jgi:antitoxin (DNA-binding transcriptional repressor) of toxin-antitoxin stability system
MIEQDNGTKRLLWMFRGDEPAVRFLKSEEKTMPTITLHEAQARLPDIVHRLSSGDEVVITEGDQVVARIVGERRPLRQRPGPGLCKDMMTIVADDEEHLKDFVEYMP